MDGLEISRLEREVEEAYNAYLERIYELEKNADPEVHQAFLAWLEELRVYADTAYSTSKSIYQSRLCYLQKLKGDDEQAASADIRSALTVYRSSIDKIKAKIEAGAKVRNRFKGE